MTLPATLSPDELRRLNDSDLFDYFADHARKTDSMQREYAYAIRFGSKSIFDADTHDLFDKFKRSVRKGWTKTKVDGAQRWVREDGCFAFRLNAANGWEWFYRTRTGKLSYGPFASAKLAMGEADRKFRTGDSE